MFGSMKRGDDIDDDLLPKIRKSGKKTIIPVPESDFFENYFGSRRFKLSLATDKDTYKPGETVFIRGIILEAFNHVPISQVDESEIGNLFLLIKSPKDEEVIKSMIQHENSVISQEWVTEEETVGGQYTIEVYTERGRGLSPSSISFNINKYNPPRFKKTLDFLQKGYSEGDEVRAMIKVERTEGGYPDPEKCVIEASGRLDGEEFFRSSNFKLNSVGKCQIRFTLPSSIAKGVGSLNVSITEGITENVSKTLPIILKKLDCFIYPEGGELYQGVKNGVYAEAFTPSLDPADFEADLVEKNEEDGSINIVGHVQTMHEGRAFFEMIPRKGCSYSLKITHPTGVTEPISLPKALESGLGLYVQMKDQMKFGEKIDVQIFDPQQKSNLTAYIGLFKREKEIDVKKIEMTGLHNVSLDPKENDGVLRITLFDGAFKPCSERLVFVPPKQTLQFDISTDKEVYAPGDHVVVTIKPSLPNTTICCTVTDDAVYKMKEKRERACRLPASQFFESEVKELYDSDSYFREDPDDEKKVPPAVKRDLLLGTQGWRRFVFTRCEEYYHEESDKKKAKKLLNVEYDESMMRDRTKKGSRNKKNRKRRKRRRRKLMDKRDEESEEEEEEDRVKPHREEEEVKKKKEEVVEEEEEEDEGEEIMAEVPVIVPAEPEELMTGEECEKEEEDMKMMMKEDIAFDIDLEGMFFLDEEKKPAINLYREYRRVYAHKVREGRVVGEREDFEETLFYEPYRKVEDPNAGMTIEFDLNDAVTTFCVFIDAVSDDGCMGYENQFLIQSLSPFYIEPKMPLELTFGDHFYLPIGINSNMDVKLQTSVKVDAKNITIPNPEIRRTLEGYERIGGYIEMKVDPCEEEEVTIRLNGSVENIPSIRDSVTRKCRLYPFGFPQTIDRGGKIDANESKIIKFGVDEEVIPGSLDTKLCVYPGPLSSLMEGVSSLIQQPGGCFEQTSMTMYPMILAIMYMKTNDKVDEELFKKASGFLESGYKRLLSYECKDGGYEWFGESPGHESLTSMGVLEFTDLKLSGFPVDDNMVKRTVEWLSKRLKVTGDGFERNPRALDYFGGAPPDVTDAYIVYAMSRSKAISYEKLEKCLLKLEKDCETKDDSYFISLVALSLFNFGKAGRAKQVVDSMVKRDFQKASGLVDRSNTSITSSSGEDLQVQTTSLAILNFLNFKDEYMDLAEQSISFLETKNRGGRFGSTQSTVLALMAMVRFAEASAVAEEDGSVQVEVNGTKLPKKDFAKGSDDPIVVQGTDISSHILPGQENEIKFSMIEGCKMPYSFQLNYYTPKPSSDPNLEEKRKLTFHCELKNNVIKEGDLTEILIQLENVEKEKHQGMTCVVINIPSGLVLRYKKLEELKKTKIIDAFELMGSRKLVLYWRQMLKDEKKSFMVETTGDIPGEWNSMASYAYLYYDDVTKYYVDGLKIQVLKNED